MTQPDDSTAKAAPASPSEEGKPATASALDTKTAIDLGWDVLLDRIARNCRSPDAHRAVCSLEPASTPNEARARTAELAEACAVTEAGEPIPVTAIAELEEAENRIARGAVATAEELGHWLVVLRHAAELGRYARRHQAEAPALASALATDPSLAELGDRLDQSLDLPAAVADGASTELARKRRQAADVRTRIVSKLDRLMARHAELLRDRYYDVRDGRYVLPVRSDAHVRVEGIVLGASASGGTLYVEPAEITPLGNSLKMAESDAAREEARVLSELSAAVRERLDSVRVAREACVRADVLAALVRWAREMDARPVAVTDEPELRLEGFRHPLLDPGQVVGNDFELHAGRALVLSGPNAGGKTVALECLGLAAWMARAGLPVPTGPRSTIGWFAPVLSDVGDEQSLSKSLSTFSAHVTNLAAMLERADGNTLVLLDELAASTDPEEGAALATAVLEALVERGAAVAVTTHYERLKELATDDDRFTNASVGFDMSTMLPTFSIALGVPGPSSALAVATRYGIEPAVVERARALIPEASRTREAVLGELEAERVALARARSRAEADSRAQAALRAELESERRAVRSKERARLEREARSLMEEVRRARTGIERAKEKIGKAKSRSGVRDAEREVDQAARVVAIGSPLVEQARAAEGPQAPASRAPRRGDRVRVRRLGTTAAEVLDIEGGRARILAGVMKLTVPVDELTLVGGSGPSNPSRPKRPQGDVARAAAQYESEPLRTTDNTVDVRGLRADDALGRVDAFLDQMMGEGEAAGYVLHGHGTGALKEAVRVHLHESAYVERAREAAKDRGGDAFTVFWLKT